MRGCGEKILWESDREQGCWTNLKNSKNKQKKRKTVGS